MAKRIYFGTSKLKKAKIGSVRVKKVYIGTALSWQDIQPGFITLSTNSMSVGTRKTGSFNINTTHGGALSVSCTGNVSATMSGSTVVVTGAYSTGSGTVTVTCAATEDYTAASATVSVSVYQSTISFTVNGSVYWDGGSADYSHYFTTNYLNTFGDILPYDGTSVISTNRPYISGYGYSWGYLKNEGGSYVRKRLDGFDSYNSGIYRSGNYVSFSDTLVDGMVYTSEGIYS